MVLFCALAFAARQDVVPLAVAGAFAYQARAWLLALAAVRRRESLALADALEARRPASASVFVDHDIESLVPLDALREGHLFRVGAGQAFPADGVVTLGSGSVDESFGEAEERDHAVRLQDRDEHYWLYAARVASEA